MRPDRGAAGAQDYRKDDDMNRSPFRALAAALAAVAGLAGGQAQAGLFDGRGEDFGAGRHQLQVGLLHIDTLDDSQPLRTQLQPGFAALAGVQGDFESPGTAARVSASDTLATVYSYFLTDSLAIKLEGGIPARFKLYGSGTVQPTGPLGAFVNVDLGDPANNPLAKVTQWSPVLLLQYYFRRPAARLRPSVGIGVTYTWFTDIKLDPDFAGQLNSQFGQALALANLDPGTTTASGKSSDDIAPVFNLGVVAQLSPHWSLSGSMSYTLLKTTATIAIDAADGERLATSRTRLDLDPLVIAVLLGYRFDL